jgi:hypothetical protein
MLQKILNLFRRKKDIPVKVNLIAWDLDDVERLRNIVSLPVPENFPLIKNDWSLFVQSIPFPDIYPFPCDNADDEQERYTKLATAFTRRRTLAEMDIPESTFEKEDQNLLANAYAKGVAKHNEELRLRKIPIKKAPNSAYDTPFSDREPYESNRDSGTDWPLMDYGDSSPSSSDSGFDFGGGSGDGGGATGEY